MSNIFFPLKNFNNQSKKDWNKKFLSENKKNKIHKIQHKINGASFDPIYFNNEIKEKNTFSKKQTWKISCEILAKNIQIANAIALI